MTPWFKNPVRIAALRAELESWPGTPFFDHGRIKGRGVDCVQFAGAVYIAVGLLEEFKPREYQIRGGRHSDVSIVTEWLEQSPAFAYQGDNFPMNEIAIGDLLTFTIARAEWHVGIVYSACTFMHCIQRHGVITSRIDDSTWAKRLTGVWRPVTP